MAWFALGVAAAVAAVAAAEYSIARTATRLVPLPVRFDRSGCVPDSHT